MKTTPKSARFTLMLATVFFMLQNICGQTIMEKAVQRDELYFSFRLDSRNDIREITDLISIDNVRGDSVWAYASMAKYLKFMTLGYEIHLLPHPGDGPGVEMTDHVALGPLTTWDYYPDYYAYESLMAQFQIMYPGLCNLDTIATLASGRRLLVLKLSDNVTTDEAEPEFLYSSSIHGDELTGYILMLHLADYLLSNYGTNPEATELINNLEIYICPLANPDGTFYGGNSTVSGARRFNINGVDLNRNYPDPQNGQHPDGYSWQPETMAFMDFATQRHFVAGANFHGGAEVVNYPWDTWPTLHADDNWWQYISREYADTVHMHSPSTYMDDLNNGITNGYAWYEVNGGRQDYMNYFHHCRELTIEISNIKLLPAGQLVNHWNYNWRSLILFLKEARYGIHGIITDQMTGLPVAAKVFINGHDNNGSEVYASAGIGDYHRLLKAGTYTLEFSSPCHQTQTISGITISDHATVNLNIQMVPLAPASVTTAPVTSISSSGAISGGNVTCTGNTPVTARGVCWGTTANPVATGNHTANGGGPGIYSSQITGLSPSTLYHVRAYATNSSGTYYGTDIQFTTSCGAVAAFPWNEGFENNGAIPGCWVQEQVNSSGVNWVFISGSGNGNPAGPHGGAYNACLKDVTRADNKTRLVTPPLNLASLPLPQVKFWYTQASWSGDQDQLSVFYKTSSAGNWTLLASYISSITAWTQVTLSLPNPTGDYYIAFEGNAKWGYGVCVDDVQVSTSCETLLPVSVSISADANPVNAGTQVTFSAIPVNGGAAPAYQWKVNGENAGTNNPVFVYIPLDGDVITCVMTSDLTCVSGNPAVSDPVTMVVISVPDSLELQSQSVSDTICFNALQTITVAGNGTFFHVLSGGSATMISGGNIRYLPGTLLDSGACVHGYITIDDHYCSLSGRTLITAIPDEAGKSQAAGHAVLKIYPNPTNGDFTIEIAGQDQPGKVNVQIFGIRGEKIFADQLTTGRKYEFSLAGHPAGLYLVQIFTGNLRETARLIRKD